MAAKIIQDKDNDETSLFIDGEFIAGWSYIEIPEESIAILNHMLSVAVEKGMDMKMLEVQKFLGIK